MLGWRWVKKSGFFTGLELGVQLAVTPVTFTPSLSKKSGDDTSTLPTGQTLTAAIDEQVTSVQNILNTYGSILARYPLPHLMFNIGYLF
jgi:hypothetical protein